MSELKRCNRCTFTAPLDEWPSSSKGRKFSLCVRCREYHNKCCKSNSELKRKQIEYKI